LVGWITPILIALPAAAVPAVPVPPVAAGLELTPVLAAGALELLLDELLHAATVTASTHIAVPTTGL
jgi:hypothetical protein